MSSTTPPSSKKSKDARKTGSAPAADSKETFAVGTRAKVELKRALKKAAADPAGTIQAFQTSHSLHFMLSKAFGTMPIPEFQKEKSTRSKIREKVSVESLDSDSVMTFLSHLGVRQHEVHKRISDTLLKQLEDEVRKTRSQEPLLELLRDSWPYAVRLPELRPIIWGVLRQLGEKTPPEVLQALAEREESTNTEDNGDGNKKATTTKLKHADIFRPLPALLKKLVWEGDWITNFPTEPDVEPKEFLKDCESTLLYETMFPLIEQYCNNAMLVDSANQPFVATNSQRRMLTTQRRALNTTSSATSTSGNDNKPGGAAALLAGKTSGATATDAGQNTKNAVSSSKAISQLRVYLSDSGGSSTSALSYRPKMLYALLSIIIARHGALLRDGSDGSGSKKKIKQQPAFLGGAAHLHCTLVSDILLSAGGPLPKAYHHVHQLARIIDECVDNGNITNAAIKSMQGTLKEIFMADQDGSGDTTPTPKKDKDEAYEDESEKKINRNDMMTNAWQRQLNNIIREGIRALKESDAKSLFLNPVTNKIAPGYTKIIKRPMSISDMEKKIQDNKYKTVDEWESDVKLMFKNCCDYNRGESGQWFRGEAERQGQVFREEIYPQARKFYQTELAKRKTEENERKRKMAAEVPELVPLEKATKKRRKDTSSSAGSGDNKQEVELVPSMPALAFLLLTDPFLVRIIIARILREVRVGIATSGTVPCASSAVPSLLQFLHLARWSSQICAVRAKRYFVPDGGIAGLQEPEEQQHDPAVFVPYATLRQDLPLLLRLLLEAELDKRVVMGGDLHEVAKSDTALIPSPISIDEWVVGDHLEVPVTLLQAALVHICQPGNTSNASLAITFPKFSRALSQMSARQRRDGDDGDDRLFFQCLIRAVIKHKAKLAKSARDSIVKAWVSDWIAPAKREDSPAKSRGTMTSAAHECFVELLNEWSRIGNQILPRDTLLDFIAQGTEASEESEAKANRKFAALWTTSKQSRVAAFEPVKNQYLKMLSNLPATNASEWRTKMGLPPSDEEDASAKDKGEAKSSAKETDGPTPMETGD